VVVSLVVVAVAAAVAVVVLAGAGEDAAPPAASAGDGPRIGGDLHSLVADPGDPRRLFVGGHQAVGASADGGRTWALVASLEDADAMGWAFDGTTVWVSGHPGLNRSDDGGRTFRRTNQGLPHTDLHAFGAAGAARYGASPAVGVFASSDGGASWEVRSREAGRAFFGRILVNPGDPARLVAADAGAGPVESADGGRTWRRLGGLASATWVSWAGGDPTRLVASGPGGAARSPDGGRSWEALVLPQGAALVEASPAEPERLWAAGLSEGRAVVWTSADGGRTWVRP
jgi:photosystem II stability/assembly factor-like uncharacterized protein